MIATMWALASDRRGISAIEYGVLGAIIATALAVSAPPVAAALAPLFSTIAGSLTP